MSLSPQQLSTNKQDVLNILKEVSDLPDALFTFLNNSDFWKAPASTRYHEAYEGGLVEHSLKVHKELSLLNYQKLLGFSDDTVAKTALFHDLCKVNFYRKIMRNKRMDDGRWMRVAGWEVDDQLPLGHGEKSLAILLKLGVQLTEEEMLAIRWHMGGFTDSANSFVGTQALSAAMGSTSLVTALHIADMMAVWM